MISDDMSKYVLIYNIGLNSKWIKTTNLICDIIYFDGNNFSKSLIHALPFIQEAL